MSGHIASIAVLPFESQGGDDDIDYLARGFAEDLIAQLTRFPSLRIVSSQSSFAIHFQNGVDADLIGQWGLDYVLEGSIRPRGESFRVAPRLVQTAGMKTVWADQIDMPRSDIFEVQDRIVAEIAGKLAIQMSDQQLKRTRRLSAGELRAYDCWLRGMDCLRQVSIEGDAEARPLFEQAIGIDPDFALGYVGLSLSHFNEWSCQTWHLWEESSSNAFDFAKKAVAIDDTNAMSHAVMARVLHYRHEHDLAVVHAEGALTLNPNDPWVLMQVAICALFNGDFDQSIGLAERALASNPLHAPMHHGLMGWAHFMAGRPKEALPLLDKAGDLIANFSVYRAACLAELGQQEAAESMYRHFECEYQKKISFGRTPDQGEALHWAVSVEPFRMIDDRRRMPDLLAEHGIDRIDVELAIGKSPTPAVRPAAIKRPDRAVFRCDSGIWSMDYAGSGAQLTEVKGFHDLARLLTEPMTPVHCLELYGGSATRESEQAVLDPESRQAYRLRLLELQQELDQARDDHDSARIEPLQRELEELAEELARTLGLRGRSRAMGSQAERARSAITWRVRSAIKKIKAAHPQLGQHLSNSVKTGNFCTYSPESSVDWEL